MASITNRDEKKKKLQIVVKCMPVTITLYTCYFFQPEVTVWEKSSPDWNGML